MSRDPDRSRAILERRHVPSQGTTDRETINFNGKVRLSEMGANHAMLFPSMSTVGQGTDEGYLTRDEIDSVAREGLAALPVDGRRVLVIIPDGTRTMPMPLMFELLE